MSPPPSVKSLVQTPSAQAEVPAYVRALEQAASYLPADQLLRLRHAWEVGAAAHAGQTRKSGEPYITHPVAVAQVLAELGLDVETLVAAILHDTIEDTPLTHAQIVASFGESVAEMVEGVTKGFEKNLEIVGVGYRVEQKGKDLNLVLGFSHPVIYKAPEGVTLKAIVPLKISIKGIDKQKVGQAAAEIRKYRRPEPYKGKGIKYAGEIVRRKQGKKTGK